VGDAVRTRKGKVVIPAPSQLCVKDTGMH
jgi:hypothetical protein